MQLTLNYIQQLARQAGEILRDGYVSRPGINPPNQVGFKGEIDLVTEVDRRTEAFLLDKIHTAFPDHRIIAEESGGSPGREGCSWYVDPIDGTVNFAHGIPIFCVSIAFAEDGQVRIGVVYDPMRDECFSAEKDKGAWLNGEPIRVSQIKELGRSLLTTGFPYDIRTNPENNLDNYARFSLRSQAVRRLGAAALDLCYVAAGRFDGYWETSLEAWDLAAGLLIASEAGALVTDVRGEPVSMAKNLSVLAANPAVHSQMLTVLNDKQ
jgi:myo-inositol-1(or 4)-monophosphatase